MYVFDCHSSSTAGRTYKLLIKTRETPICDARNDEITSGTVLYNPSLWPDQNTVDLVVV